MHRAGDTQEGSQYSREAWPYKEIYVIFIEYLAWKKSLFLIFCDFCLSVFIKIPGTVYKKFRYIYLLSRFRRRYRVSLPFRSLLLHFSLRESDHSLSLTLTSLFTLSWISDSCLRNFVFPKQQTNFLSLSCSTLRFRRWRGNL